RVVAGGEVRSVLGRMHDLRAELVDDKAMNRIDVPTLARAEAEVVEPRAELVEGATAPGLRVRAYEDPGAAADAVDEVVALDEGPYREEVAEILPEGDDARVGHSKTDVSVAGVFS